MLIKWKPFQNYHDFTVWTSLERHWRSISNIWYEQKPNKITEHGYTAFFSSSTATTNICFKSEGCLRNQIKAAEDHSAAHVGEHLSKGGLLRPLLQASRDRHWRRRRRGGSHCSRQSLFSFPIVPAPRAVPRSRPWRTNVLFRTLHIWVCTCGSRSVFLPELIAIGWTLPAVHCVFAVQLPLKSHSQSSVLFFLLPAAPCSLFVPRHFRQERAVGWRRFTLRSSTRPLSV